ncbi:MAG: hypothetical protein CR967_02460 [Proteobacteria bacterium]|nr:MAG: hypothetical protein CR967_02460 [Pseudomonadota bacterium]
MFRQLKSALIWYYLFKFKKRITLIFFLLLIAFFSDAIYADVVQYLQLKNKLQYLDGVLILKWFIIIFNISFCIYLLLTLFKTNKEEEKPKKTPKKVKKESKKKEELSSREEKFLHKERLSNKADLLLKK